jgi:flagellum-specific ATP synthase
MVSSGEGSITAFYTVLAEGDDANDPIVDAARAVLDGHIVLSRRIADSGRYPAVDVESSVSRCMHDIVPEAQLELARRLRQMQRSLRAQSRPDHDWRLSTRQRSSYRYGDRALATHRSYMRQGMHERVN